jgi:hypothetical protein
MCIDEWDYVNGPAMAADRTPGRRDENNTGKTPETLMQEVNTKIRKFYLKSKNEKEVPDFALLNKDEVLSVRLYTGPGHQPINEFLRQIAQLSGDLRMALAKDTSHTFAATVENKIIIMIMIII